MLVKLSLRNSKRQAKDYIIYFITIIISVSLMFSFNSIAFSEDVKELSVTMKEFSSAITGINIIIVFIMAWIINYCMKFMLEKRSKEFGTYEILGIEKKWISFMFILENLVIGAIAFIIGIGFGTFLYQIFTSIIMNIFNQIYKIQISFNIRAVIITALYFFGIFIIALLNCRRKIRKNKVYNLLYADKQNESNIIKKIKGNVFLFLISSILLILGIVIIKINFDDVNLISGNKITFAIICIIIGIYLFYISLSSFIIKRYLNNKKKKYQKDNMFLARNLASKINTMSVTIGTIALMFTIILIGANSAFIMNDMLNNELEMGYPFEIMVSTPDGDFSQYKEYINKNSKVKSMHEYRLYYINNLGISKVFKNTMFSSRENTPEYVLALSDYNTLRKALGYEEVSLKNDEIYINCIKTTEKLFKQKLNCDTIKILGKDFKIKDIKTENISQMGFNGYYYTLIVPDSIIPEIIKEEEALRNKSEKAYYEENFGQKENEPETELYSFDFSYKLAVVTEDSTSQKFYSDLVDFIVRKEQTMTGEFNGETQEYSMIVSLGNVTTKGFRTSEVKSFFAIISFLAFYIALIFIMCSATLLAIQQLSDSEKYKYRYNLLKKLGMDEHKINLVIFKQVLFYFILPIILPIIISIPVILSVSKIFTVAVTYEEVFKNMIIVFSLFILVYGIYFIATAIQFDRNINGNR